MRREGRNSPQGGDFVENKKHTFCFVAALRQDRHGQHDAIHRQDGNEPEIARTRRGTLR